MRLGTTVLAGVALALAFAPPSLAQEKQLPTQTTTIVGAIMAIDEKSRSMNIKVDEGPLVTVTAPKSYVRFTDFDKGDHVTVTYNNNVLVRAKPPGEAAVDTVETEVVKAGTAGSTKSTLRRTTATVSALDQSASSITFETANGRTYNRRVVDPAVFDQVKVGDNVDITWNTDLKIEDAPD